MFLVVKRIGEFFLAPGYSTEYMYVYLASGLTPAPLAQDEDEFLSLEKIPAKQVYAMLGAGEFHDAKTLVGLFLALAHLEYEPPGESGSPED